MFPKLVKGNWLGPCWSKWVSIYARRVKLIFKKQHLGTSNASTNQVIGTCWVFYNKLDESENVLRNKAWVLAKGYNQQEGIDLDETYAPLARLKVIRILIAFLNYEF